MHGVRTEVEKDIFDRGLEVMATCYASLVGTSVLVYKDIVVPSDTTQVAEAAYNDRPYDGEGGRGWCIFEQGVCCTVVAHFNAAEEAAAKKHTSLPARFALAQSSRPKVIDISQGGSMPRTITEPPIKVLDDAVHMIGKARFTGKGDAEHVRHMLDKFEWSIREAVSGTTTDYASSGQTVDASILWRVISRRGVPSAEPNDGLARRERPTNALVASMDAL